MLLLTTTPDMARPAGAVGAVQDSNPIVVLETSLGDIRIELRPDRAPLSVENFLALVRVGHYDEMFFHRVVNDVVIQAGLLGMDGKPRGLDVEPIRNEARNRLRNRRGAVAMAREEDPHSASTEFFINVNDNRELDFRSTARREWGYAVFGEVVDGMDVVDEIARIRTREVGPFPQFPSEPVAIYRAYVIE
jgi:peptidyl-prolyl cis-trans isomerase B (cyclophilin B)